MAKNSDLGDITRALRWGLLMGGGVGFALGLLLAPEEGSQLRRRVKFHLEELAKQVGNLAANLKTSSEQEGAKSDAEAIVADAHKRAQEINSQMEEIIDSKSTPSSESE